MNILLDLAICSFYVLASVNLGAVLLGFLKVKPAQGHSPFTLIATAFLLGQVGLVAPWTTLGLLNTFSPFAIRTILLVCFFGGLFFAWPFYRAALSSLWTASRILIHELTIWKIIALLVTSLIVVDGLTAFVSPPHGDAEAFYFPIAKVMAAAERLVILPGYEAFSQVGLFGEFHFAALISLGSLEAAKWFVWFTALAAAVMLVGIGSQIGVKHRGQLLILSMLFTSSTFFYYISDGKVDLFAAALGLAAYYWALQVERIGGPFVIALVGLFSGMSVVAKISYLLAVLPPVFLLVVWRHLVTVNSGGTLRDKIFSTTKLMLSLSFWVVLALIPHMAKNATLFHQPLAPFVTSDRSQDWLNQTWFDAGVTRWILLTYPFSLVFGQYPMQGGGLSVLLLILVPLTLFLPKSPSLSNSTSFQLTLAAVMGIVLWNIFRASVFAPRYLLATLLLFIPPVAYGTEAYMQAEVKPRLLSGIAFVCILITLFVNLLEMKDHTAGVLNAYMAKDEISCTYSGCGVGVWKKVNKIAEPGERIYMANYYRFWLRSDLLQCVSTTKEREEFSLLDSPEARWHFIFEHGFHFVMMDETTHSATIEALDLTRVPDWLNVTVVVEEGPNTLLFIESLDPSKHARYACQQKEFPAWGIYPIH